MKAMDRVSRGNGFKGVLSYNLDPAKHTTIIGGNLAAGDVGAMAREFRAIAALRSDIKKPVWHQALRLPKNEKIDSAKLAEIAEAYMQKMGFDVSKHQFVIIEDKLKAGQHAHIIANRVATDGTVYLGKNENLVSSRVCGELEVKFGLEQTKQATNAQRRAISKPRKTEIEQALRTGEQPPKLQIQTICDSVLDGADYNLDQFEAELYDQGVLARRTANAKGLVGYSFSLDGEVWFKGSQLGKNYSAKKLLERGLHDGQQARASQTLTDQTNQNTTANRANQQATASRDSGIESPKPAVNRAKPDFSKLAEKLKSRPSNSRKPVSNTQATES
ncbi:MAG TPA: relaxase/mobilization nuclease domain-containing protein, partial [Pseudomonadales bacterium]|nr:relaxase/mobilization nuclease domain-containing protein [Pseudomonadales bacterium]